ncbi:hypothetical protein ABW44_12510 [Stenotrophomonas maltophilia]|nr:hypothetical protein ABW44_12510 [Stenotrophomonas maltophilia]
MDGTDHWRGAAITGARHSAIATQGCHTTQPSGCRRVMACAVCGQQDLQHHAQARQRTVGIGQGQSSAGRLMPFPPGLAIGSSAGADAVQQGNEGVWIQRRPVRGHVMDGVRGGGAGLGHGWAPCV